MSFGGPTANPHAHVQIRWADCQTATDARFGFEPTVLDGRLGVTLALPIIVWEAIEITSSVILPGQGQWIGCREVKG